MNFLHATLFLAALVLAQLFFGGGDFTRLIYMLPSCIVLGISGILASTAIRRAPARMDRWCLLSAAVFAVFLVVRIAFSPSPWLARADLFSVATALLVYFLAALCTGSSRARIFVVAGLLILGVAQSVIGFYQFVREPGFHPLLEAGIRGASTRASGLFVNANHLAGFLEVALLLAVSLCFWGGFGGIGRMLAGYSALVCLTGLLLTGSRGGYLSATAGFVVFAMMSVWTMRARLSNRLLLRLVAVAAVILLLVGVLLWAVQGNPEIRVRANTAFTGLEARPMLWEAAWKQFQLAPVFGTGSRTYTYYGRMFRDMHIQRETDSPHSDWLQLLAEYGIVGALLAACLVFVHLRHGGGRWLRMVRHHSSRMTSTEERGALALQIGAISAVSALLIHAVVDFNFHIPSNLMVAAFLFGLLAARRTRAEEWEPGWPQRALNAVPAGLGLGMLILAAPQFRGEQLAERARKAFVAGDMETVLAVGGQAVAHGARNPELHFEIGEVKRLVSLFMSDPAEQRASLGEAHAAYSASLALYPQEVRCLLRDAWVLGRLGRLTEAEQLLGRAKEIDPKSPAPWVCSALHWHRLGRHAEALADYRAAEKRGGALIPSVLIELVEQLDPGELEKLAKGASPGP